MVKVAVFIDHSNVFRQIRNIKKADPGWICMYDPFTLAKKLAGNRELVHIGFYCVRPPAYLLKENKWHQGIYTTTNKYYSAIEKLPLITVKYGYLTGPKKFQLEKNLDTQLCSDLVLQAALGDFDVAIIVANDGDYVGAVGNVKILGKKVENVFFKGGLSMNLDKVSDLTRRARKSYFQPIKFDGDATLFGDNK